MKQPDAPEAAPSSAIRRSAEVRVAAVLLVAMVSAFSVSCGEDGDSADTTVADLAETTVVETSITEVPTTSPSPAELESLEMVSGFEVGQQLWTSTLVGEDLWVPRKGGVSVISTRDDSITFLDFEGAAETPLFAAGRVWVPNLDVPTLTVFDPNTMQEITTVAVGNQGFSPVSLGGYVWVPNRDDATVSRVDMGTFDVLSIPLSPGFGTLLVVDGGVETRASDAYWRIELDGTATQIDDPRPLPVELDGDEFRVDGDRTSLLRSSTPGGDPAATIPIGSRVNQLTVTGDWVWADTAAGFVRVDPGTNSASDPIQVEANGGYVGSDTGLWIATRGDDDGEVTFIQSSTGKVATLAVEGRPDTPTVVDDGAYVSLVFGSRVEQVVRIEPVFSDGS